MLVKGRVGLEPGPPTADSKFLSLSHTILCCRKLDFHQRDEHQEIYWLSFKNNFLKGGVGLVNLVRKINMCISFPAQGRHGTSNFPGKVLWLSKPHQIGKLNGDSAAQTWSGVQVPLHSLSAICVRLQLRSVCSEIVGTRQH